MDRIGNSNERKKFGALYVAKEVKMCKRPRPSRKQDRDVPRASGKISTDIDLETR